MLLDRTYFTNLRNIKLKKNNKKKLQSASLKIQFIEKKNDNLKNNNKKKQT